MRMSKLLFPKNHTKPIFGILNWFESSKKVVLNSIKHVHLRLGKCARLFFSTETYFFGYKYKYRLGIPGFRNTVSTSSGARIHF